MKEGANLLIANVPAMALASLAAFLIHDGHSAWTWGWFLIVALILGVTPKSDSHPTTDSRNGLGE